MLSLYSTRRVVFDQENRIVHLYFFWQWTFYSARYAGFITLAFCPKTRQIFAAESLIALNAKRSYLCKSTLGATVLIKSLELPGTGEPYIDPINGVCCEALTSHVRVRAIW
jgi:hypothetical protein